MSVGSSTEKYIARNHFQPATLKRMTGLGKRLRAARENKGLSMSEVGRQIGVAYQSIAAIEHGKVQGTKHLHRLAKVLEVDPDWLETGEPGGAAQPFGVDPDQKIIHPHKEHEGRLTGFEPVTYSAQRDLKVLGIPAADGGGLDLQGYKVQGRVARPPYLTDNDSAYAVLMPDTSMEPRYFVGERLYLDPTVPLKVGAQVLVHLRDGRGFVRVFEGRAGKKLVTKQFNPPKRIEYDGAEVEALHVVRGCDIG